MKIRLTIYEKKLQKYFILVTVSLFITIFWGLLSIYQLSLNYLPEKKEQAIEKFLTTANTKFNELQQCFRFVFLNRDICNNLIDQLKYTRERYQKICETKNMNTLEPIYMSRILIEQPFDLKTINAINSPSRSEVILFPCQDFVVLAKSNTDLINAVKYLLKIHIEKCLPKE